MRSLLRSRSALAALLAVVLLASACGDDDAAADTTVVASINGRELTQSQLDDLLPDGENTVDTRVASILTAWLTSQALEFELEERGAPITDDDREAAAAIAETREGNDTEIAQLEATLALGNAVNRWAAEQVESLDDPDPPDFLCANHLLVDAEEDAAAALQRFIDGEAFADLAMELSTGPTGPNGGDLGCAVRGQYVPEFEEAAYVAEAGEVVGPVETQFGWHLIEVESVGPATVDNHPTADPAQILQVLESTRAGLFDTVILDLEGSAQANYRDDAFIDPDIGTFEDENTLVITPA